MNANKKRLLLDSRFATQNQFDNSFRFTFDPTRIRYARLLSAIVANTHFAVMSEVNNYLDIVYNGVNKTIVIDEGNYSTSTMIAQLSAKFTAQNINCTVTYNSQTYQFVFVFGYNTKFLLNTGANRAKSAYLLLGFNQVDTSTSTILSSNNVPVLSVNYCLIDIKEFESQLKTNTSQFDNSYSFYIPFENVASTIQTVNENVLCNQVVNARDQIYTELNISLYVIMGTDVMDLNSMSYKGGYPFVLLLEIE